jgi:hypothetical protein
MKTKIKPNIWVVIVKDDYTDNLVDLLSTHYNITDQIFIGKNSKAATYSALSLLDENTELIGVFGNNTSIDWDDLYPDNTYNKKNITKQRVSYSHKLFNMCSEQGIKMVGFGNGSTYIGLRFGCKLLFNNSDIKTHSTTFIIGEKANDVTFNVNSNHSVLLYPRDMHYTYYDIRAFSAYYSEVVYHNSVGDIINVGKNFVESEIIKFDNAIVFQYDVPKPEESVIKNLTIQNILL